MVGGETANDKPPGLKNTKPSALLRGHIHHWRCEPTSLSPAEWSRLILPKLLALDKRFYLKIKALASDFKLIMAIASGVQFGRFQAGPPFEIYGARHCDVPQCRSISAAETQDSGKCWHLIVKFRMGADGFACSPVPRIMRAVQAFLEAIAAVQPKPWQITQLQPMIALWPPWSGWACKRGAGNC